MPKQTVVFDTNVLITLPLSASFSTRLFLRLDAGGWEVAASPQILLELADKLHTKESLRTWPAVPDDQIEVFLNETILEMVTLLPGHRQAHGAVKADSKDDMIIAAALESKASYIRRKTQTFLGQNAPDRLICGVGYSNSAKSGTALRFPALAPSCQEKVCVLHLLPQCLVG